MGIGISIIAAFLLYVALFYGSFAVSSAASQITTVSDSLSYAVDILGCHFLNL